MKNKYYQITTSILMTFFTCFLLFDGRILQVDSFKSLFFLNSNNLIISSIVFVFIYHLYYKFLIKKYSKKIFVSSLILAFIFSLTEIIGFYLDNTSSFFEYKMNVYTIIYNVFLFVGYLSIFYSILCKVLNYFIIDKNVKKKSDDKYNFFTNNKKSLIVVTLFLIMCWLIYYFIFYPGVVTQDTYYQINQGMGFIPLTNEHPFLHTVYEGIIIRFGTFLFGNINQGIALCSFIQMIVMAFVISYVIKYLASKKVHPIIRIIVLLFYALHPVIGIYSITLWKDVWMGLFNLTYLIILYELCVNSNEFFKSRKKIFLLLLNILLILFAKGTGIIIIIMSFIPLVFLKSNLKKLVLLFSIPVIIFLSVNTIAQKVLNVASGHIREPLSIPIQQLSRTVQKHQENMNKEDIKVLNEILPVDKLGGLYNPQISDNTKRELNETNLKEKPLKYFVLWFKLGIKYPCTYIDSFLANSYGYWYPESIYWEVAQSNYLDMLNDDIENNGKVYDVNYSKYQINTNRGKIKNFVYNFVNYYPRKIPIIGCLFSIGFYFWTSLICLVITILKKQYNILPLHFITIATFIISISSPVYAEFRYAYVALITLPIILIISLGNIKSNNCLK